MTFPEGLAPTAADDEKRLLLKICSILNSGGGGGSGTTQVYIGKDPTAPDDPTKAALSYPSGGGTMTQWDVASQTWK